MLPPYGWKKHEKENETLFIGHAFKVSWPFLSLFAGFFFLGFHGVMFSLLILASIICLASVFSLLHGYRIAISADGIYFLWTYCGISYKSISLPLNSIIRTEGGFGESDDMVIIERSENSKDVVIELYNKSIRLSEELKESQYRWQATRLVVH